MGGGEAAKERAASKKREVMLRAESVKGPDFGHSSARLIAVR